MYICSKIDLIGKYFQFILFTKMQTLPTLRFREILLLYYLLDFKQTLSYFWKSFHFCDIRFVLFWFGLIGNIFSDLIWIVLI